MDTLTLTRYDMEKASMHPHFQAEQEFFYDSPKHGKAVAIYTIQLPNTGCFLISEYEDGNFWTIGGREDCLGSLSKCINFLIESFT